MTIKKWRGAVGLASSVKLNRGSKQRIEIEKSVVYVQILVMQDKFTMVQKQRKIKRYLVEDSKSCFLIHVVN